MAATLTIRDETATGKVSNEFPLEFPTERITIRELIRERVYQEVQDYNVRRRQETAEFRGLVIPRDAERSASGVRTHRDIDWKKQYEKAIEAFEGNGYFVLVGARQAGSLDEQIMVARDTVVSFVKLTPLVGG